MCERRLLKSRCSLPEPSQKIRTQLHALLAVQHESFPRANRRYPKLIFFGRESLMRSGAEPLRAVQKPDPNMSVQEKLQSRRASMSSRSITGDTISPRISIEFRIDPKRAARSIDGAAGMTSATGLPCRVMRSGFFVLRTCSSKARHLALNSEMGISSTAITWSEL